FKAPARQLYTLLLAPAAKQLSGKKRLLICPDGPLWGLPFQALLIPPLPQRGRGGQGARADTFLWERFEIAYAYSATGAQAPLLAGRQRPSGDVLAFANPDFGSETRFAVQSPLVLPRPSTATSVQTASLTLARGPVLTQRGGITPLPGTRQEAQALAKDF